LHDAFWCRGRYFIHFGAAPAVAAFGPVHLLTRQFINERFVIAGLAGAGFLLSVAILLDARRLCFAKAPGGCW